ncbi:cytochrome c oxidase assembly factor CtaG [Halalkalibacter nanhaiisediminis]|uniref:Putative membrane protein n=1 Tax=Halalkalibacter nanhaiisediminis TaxID=688079 RepID=A0A562QKH2_9BACI|nr:cytochrome c oxidase assembly factor CtaG [Halalkalibacter nanhaiisediminis]TWI57205.1 putative membrane protein [Halalkalibacter nanhaiisediminis]
MGVLFQNFGFRALWTPELLIPLVFLGLIYFWLIKKWSRFKDGAPVPFKQRFYFILALVALYVGWGSPFYLAGHIMISFHMIQMVFAYFIAAPLLLLGIPSWMFQALIDRFRTPLTVKIFRVIWSPIFALFFFNGLFSFYHVPFMFDTLMQSVILHSLYQYLLFIAAVLMWWHMIAPVPSTSRLSDLRRIGYIFANGILITPACALIIFAPEPLYQTYTDPTIWSSVMAYCLPAGAEVPMSLFAGPNSFAFLETRMDQQLAGALMKIMQEIAYGITIGYVFKQWLLKEKLQDGELTISDIPTAKS